MQNKHILCENQNKMVLDYHETANASSYIAHPYQYIIYGEKTFATLSSFIHACIHTLRTYMLFNLVMFLNTLPTIWLKKKRKRGHDVTITQPSCLRAKR